MTTRRWLVGVMLFAGVMLGLNLAAPWLTETFMDKALGQNRATAGGDYVLASARTSSSAEILYVVDVRLKRMVVYASKRGGRAAVEVIDGRDLNADFPGGCSGEIVMQPVALSDNASGMAVMDTANRKMVMYVSRNYGKLEVVGVMDVSRDTGK